MIGLRIKKISSDKIIVQLTDSDLEYFDLDIDRSQPQAADLHKLLFEVMELVKTETGFDPYNGGQVIVEASMSQNGMSLIISKIRSRKQKMTREEFSKVKSVSVKSGLTAEDIRKIADNLKPCKKTISKKSILIFDSYEDLETAMCVVPCEEFNSAKLYRRGGRYAVVYKKAPECKSENILSEYSVHTLRNDIVANSINESWDLVTHGCGLMDMADNIRKMNYL